MDAFEWLKVQSKRLNDLADVKLAQSLEGWQRQRRC